MAIGRYRPDDPLLAFLRIVLIMPDPASGSTRLASALQSRVVQLRPVRGGPLQQAARRLIPRLIGPCPFCPTRPQSRSPQTKRNRHDQRTLRYSPAHHRQDRQRDRAWRGRLPPPLASVQRQQHATVNIASKKAYRGVNVHRNYSGSDAEGDACARGCVFAALSTNNRIVAKNAAGVMV